MHQLRRHPPRTRGEALDKYLTKPSVVKQCLEQIGSLSAYDCVIEPSAGAGAFLDEIGHCCVIGLDIEPQHERIVKQDWLTYFINQRYESVLVIGNPPFGQYHKLSAAFIKHAMTFNNVRTVAFILPNVYRKHTRQRILPSTWRIVSITELDRNSFTLDGKEYHIPTSFFVFDRSDGPDLRVNLADMRASGDFRFCSPYDYDLFVFGASPKKVILNPAPNNRGHYLKAKIPVADLMRKIKSVEWKGNSCASGGVYWLTKFEFVDQYRQYHD